MIKHFKVSAIPDEGDTTLVRPSDWNADHVIDNATITLAKLADVSATQRVLGRNTAAAGPVEEVTAGQLFDWVSATNGVLLTRTGGSWGPIANVATDGNDLVVTANAAAAAPAAGKVTVGAVDMGGRVLPGALGALGAQSPLAPHMSSKAIGLLVPNGGGSTTLNIFGLQNAVVVGTVMGRTPAAGSILLGARRLGYVSAAGAASVSGIRTSVTPYYLGNAVGAGGFHLVIRFAISDAVIVNGRMFIGLQAANGAPTDVNPSTFANMIGIGCDGGDTAMQVYASGAAAQARTSLGVNFPVNTTNTDLYELVLYAAPNATQVTYRVTRINTGHVATGTIAAGASLPANTTFLALQMWRANNGIASAVGIDVLQVYIEQDY